MPGHRQCARYAETLGLILIGLLIVALTLARFWRGIYFHPNTPTQGVPGAPGSLR